MKTDLIHALAPLSFTREFAGDTLAYFYFQNDKKTADLNSQTLTEFQELAKAGIFTASAKSCFFIRESYIEKTNLVVAGLGNKKIFTPETARLTGGAVYNKINSEKVKHFGLHVDSLLKLINKNQANEVLAAFLEGFYLASYSFDKYKSNKTTLALKDVVLVSEDRKNEKWLAQLASDVLTTVDCIFTTRDFSNEPSNHGTPEFYGNEISKLAKRYGLKCKVMGEAECKKENMNLFLAVSAGSAREAKCVILEYTPKKAAKNAKTIAIVGKGVTFDSGGISIKPSLRMEDMKHDMTGAATMLGATLLAARLNGKNKMVTILLFTENMPNGDAVQPGNVITARNGKTVEIINTDAEGRLVLADGLDLAHDYKPNLIINSATLTGAATVALGRICSALFSNDDNLADKMLASTEVTEEALWQLPLWDEYFDDLKSNTADMMNSANDGAGGTIRGAIFMKQFIKPGMPWAHIDLANRAYDQGYLTYNPRKGASGLYVRTFAHFVLNY
jgi:leucyl aminopeptidase